MVGPRWEGLTAQGYDRASHAFHQRPEYGQFECLRQLAYKIKMLPTLNGTLYVFLYPDDVTIGPDL